MWFYGIHDTIWRDRPADSNGRRRTAKSANDARRMRGIPTRARRRQAPELFSNDENISEA